MRRFSKVQDFSLITDPLLLLLTLRLIVNPHASPHPYLCLLPPSPLHRHQNPPMTLVLSAVNTTQHNAAICYNRACACVCVCVTRLCVCLAQVFVFEDTLEA